MAEPKDPKRPAPPPSGGSGKPLPRIWKHEPDEFELREIEEEKKRREKAAAEPPPAAPVRREKPKKKKVEKAPDKPGEKGVLVEETPELDTYETRQRVRILIGVAMLASVLTIGFFVVHMFLPEPSTEDAAAETGLPPVAPAASSREKTEQEGQMLLDRLREVAKGGNTTLAISMLKKVTVSYPATKAASDAKEALARPAQNLPLFLDRPAVVASPEAAKAEAAKNDEPKAVQANPTQVVAAKGAEATLVLPANAAEPLPGGTPPTTDPPGRVSRPLPNGFYARPGAKVLNPGWPLEIVGQRDGAPMVLVTGGLFLQGRDGGDPAEGPAHKAHVSTFYIDQHEVTVRQFKLFQKEAGRRTDRDRALSREPSNAELDAVDDRPVVFVSARDASDFAAWAGKRLPTEAQWEAAARSPDGRIFPWGNTPGTPRADRKTQPVMTNKVDLSPCGAFDLGSNAWEWTKDWYDPRYYQRFRTAPAEDPSGPSVRPRTQQLVVKGGSAEGLVTRREGYKFDTRLPHLGFRCVLTVEGPGNAFEPTPAEVPAKPGTPARGGGGTEVVPF